MAPGFRAVREGTACGVARSQSRIVLIGPPLIQLMVFGYAATFDLNRVPIAVWNQDRSAPSHDLVARFVGSPTFRTRRDAA